MGYSPPPSRYVGETRFDRWWRRTPHLPLPGTMWKQIDTRIRVEPVSAHRERWNWRVELIYDGRPDPSRYTMGGSRRHPAPSVVAGRARDEGTAWERAREVVDDFRERWAAEQLRRSMVRHQDVPQ